MSDNKIKINVVAETDAKEVEDLQDVLKAIENTKIEVETDVDDKKIHATEKDIKNLNGKKLLFETDVDTVPLNQVKRIIKDLDGENVKIDVDVDDKEIKSAKMEVKNLDGETVSVNIDCDDTSLKNVRKELNDLNGEHVQVNIDVDDSEIRKAKSEIQGLGSDLTKSLGSTDSAITGLVSTMAGKSIWDIIYGTSKKAETNKVLLRNMADTTVAYDEFYNTIDKTTDSSLISMQSLIPALNAIQSATGSTGETMNKITPQVAEFGQYVLALYGSEALAESAMMDLSKGIKGACASLDQYGITEESLKNTGLWTGEEDDVIGYMNAIDELDGETDKLMDTAQGLEALMSKAFSRGGKRLGEYVLPAVKDIMTGFMQMDTATNGWLSTSILAIGGVMTGLTSFLSVAGQALNGVQMIGKSLKWLRTIEIMEGVSGLFAIGWLLLLIAIGVAIGLLFIYLYNNVDWFREGVDNAVASLKGFVDFVWSSLVGTFNWLSGLFTDFTNQIGLDTSDWKQAILGFILFLPQLGLRLGQLFVDAIAKALGFGDDFTNSMINGAVNAVNGFISWISQLPSKLNEELNAMLDRAKQFALDIANVLTGGAAGMVVGWLTGSGEHSPGFMYDALLGELTAMLNLPSQYLSQLTSWISDYGYQMADALSQALLGISFDEVVNNVMWLLDTLNGLWDWIYTAGGLIPETVNVTGNSVIDTIIRVLGFVGTLPIQLGMILANAIGQVVSFGSNFVQSMVEAGTNAVTNFTSSISNLGNALATELQNMINDALNFAGSIGQILWDAGVNAITGFLNGLDRHSPGVMQREFVAELTEMTNFVPSISSKMSKELKNMSEHMVRSFNNHNFEGMSFEFKTSNSDYGDISDMIERLISILLEMSMGNATINIYGDVDNDKRVKQIVDVIRRELHWNNKTANRSV